MSIDEGLKLSVDPLSILRDGHNAVQEYLKWDFLDNE